MSATQVVNSAVKVLHIGKFYPPQCGGMETHLKTLCEGLSQYLDVEAIVSNSTPKTLEEVVENVPVTRMACVAKLASTTVNPLMHRAIRRRKADVIHLHWPNPMAALAYLASKSTAHLVLTYHSDVVKQRFLGVLFSPVLRVLLRRAKAIIVSSRRYLETSTPLKEYRDRCHIVPFGLSEASFDIPDAATVAHIRAQYGNQIILSVGRLVEYKGFDCLIRAMASVRGRLLIAGDGPLKRTLVALTHSLGLADRVIFVGACSDEYLRSLYHAADLLVLASTNRREAFGIVQMEAMAAGKPVINTNIDSGVPFVSLDNVTGLTVPPSDPVSLAQAIERLWEDTDLRMSLASAARKRAETTFRSATMTARTVRVYESILLARPHSRQIATSRVEEAWLLRS